SQRIDTRRARHFQVVRRVTDHESFILGRIQFLHQLEQHGRVRLGIGFVGAARCPEMALQLARLERTIEPAAALAGGDGQQMLLGQIIQQLAHSGEQLHRVLAREEMLAVMGDEVGIALDRQVGHGKAQRVVHAEPDSVRGALARRDLDPRVPGGLADAVHDRARRVDDRAVPVEHQQPVAHARFRSTNARISAGSGEASLIGSLVSGWRKASLPACSRRRCFSSRLSAKSPYLSSPTIGWPACARCTRIWWVRPVSRWTSSRLSWFLLLSSFALVTALTPSACTATRRSPEAVTYLCRDSRRSSVFRVSPLTTAR